MQIRFVLIFMLVVLGAFSAQSAPTSDELYQKAYEQFLKRDYQNASSLLDQISPADQQKADILNLRGAIYKRLGELDNAANAFNDALKINPKDWVPKFNLAEINFLRGEYKTARSFLQESLSAMPEVDRVQKQDLILYKVYLTFLLDNENDKAKLLLDSFDSNSPNPVYYFAQAAWNFKNKDADKAKILIESTDGLYSQELRNSYSQALVDVGWMEPLEGVKQTTVATNATATDTPSPTPASSPTPDNTAVASASASPNAQATSSPLEMGIVPLASSSATPLPTKPGNEIGNATPIDLGVALTPTPASTEGVPAKSSPAGFILVVLIVVAAAGIILMLLARRSRPASSTPELVFKSSGSPSSVETESDFSEFADEGTGEVRDQEPAAPAPIAIKPRNFVPGAPAEEEPVTAVSLVQAKTSKSITTRKSTPARTAPAKTVAPKTAPTRTPFKKTAKAPAPAPAGKAKTSGKATPVPAISLVASTPARSAKGKAKPASKSTPTPTPAPVPVKPSSKTKAAPSSKASAKAPVKTAAKTSIKAAKPTKASKAVAVAPVIAPVVEPKRTRMIAPVEEPKRTRVIPAPFSQENQSPAISLVKPVKKSTPAPAKAKATTKPKTEKSVPAPAPANRSSAPLITIPEFEDEILNQQAPTVLRVVPNRTLESETSSPDDGRNS